MQVSEMSKVQKYTYDNTVENIVLLEEHLKDLTGDAENKKDAFCKECAYKHCSLISGLSKEGIGFFGDPIWSEIRIWAMSCRDALKDITKNKAVTYADIGRRLRKRLIDTYNEECSVCESASKAIKEIFTKKHLGNYGAQKSASHFGHLKS